MNEGKIALIHTKIATVCNHLTSKYSSKKYGGYNIYEDDKVYMYVDTYVPNVELDVKLPSGERERTFSRSYSGYQTTYHEGKWECYLDLLYQKALVIEQAKIQKAEQEKIERLEKEQAPASKEAESVFGYLGEENAPWNEPNIRVGILSSRSD